MGGPQGVPTAPSQQPLGAEGTLQHSGAEGLHLSAAPTSPKQPGPALLLRLTQAANEAVVSSLAPLSAAVMPGASSDGVAERVAAEQGGVPGPGPGSGANTMAPQLPGPEPLDGPPPHQPLAGLATRLPCPAEGTPLQPCGWPDNPGQLKGFGMGGCSQTQPSPLTPPLLDGSPSMGLTQLAAAASALGTATPPSRPAAGGSQSLLRRPDLPGGSEATPNTPNLITEGPHSTSQLPASQQPQARSLLQQLLLTQHRQAFQLGSQQGVPNSQQLPPPSGSAALVQSQQQQEGDVQLEGSQLVFRTPHQPRVHGLPHGEGPTVICGHDR